MALLTALTACGVAEEPAPRAPAVDAAEPAPASGEPFRRLVSPVPHDPLLAERGIGVVFPPHPPGVPGSTPDTVTVLDAPEAEAPVAARLVRSPTWEYSLEARSDVFEGGGVEFGYEEVGLPVLEARRASEALEWLHVQYGRADDGSALTGWVPFEPDRVEFLPWSEQLPGRPLFFLDPDSIRFHSAPDGARVGTTLAPHASPQRFDYVLYPLETEGPWMRVEVVTPSDYCFDPDAPRRDTVWIRHLDAGGRPRVWYHTRGC